MDHCVFIAAGSNLGDRQANLDQAVGIMGGFLHVLRSSPIYETSPWGYLDQGLFLNQVYEAETDLEPQALLYKLKETEKIIGREPTFCNGPRKIDLDMIFFDDLVLKLPGLEIPHPRISARAFVLIPLADLIPDYIHPVHKRSINSLVATVDKSGVHAYSPE